MNERWVCKQCFAANEEKDSACGRCGLIRGSEATPAGESAWAAQTKPAPAPAWRRLIGFWWVPALAISLLVGYLASARRDDSGVITAGGTVAIEEIRVGDCFNAPDEDVITEVTAVPCTDAHAYELFHVATWTGSSAYPSDEAMLQFVIDECVPVFGSFVGRSYETSTLDFLHLSPVQEGWDGGDREFQCVLVDPENPTLETSLHGADR